MAKQAPIPVDVLDFQFKLHCRLKIFSNEDNAVFSKPCNLISVASRFGLIFIGTSSAAFQVVQGDTIESYSTKEGDVTDYSRRTVSLPSPPNHLSVNCDSTQLAVIVEKDRCPVMIVYDVASFTKQEISIIREVRLSASPGVTVIETSWNPSIPNIFTACKSDGTLGLYEIKDSGIDINELPADSQATCMCWSPKGKQIAVGSRDGKITQYKPDLKAMKVVNPPPMEEPNTIINLQWISNYQFIAMFQNSSGASLLVIDAPKTGETTYTNYEDICYSYVNSRAPQFYMIFQPIWNILMVASSNSMEVGVMGNENDQWVQWILGDSARAELPLSLSKQETMPIGLEFDTASTEPVLWGETSLPPAPMLLILSHHGLLCCFKAINAKLSTKSICHEPEKLKDTSGLSYFKAADTKKEFEVPPKETSITPILPPTSITAPVPVKPTVAAPQVTFSFSSATVVPSTAPNLFSTPNMFGSSVSTFDSPKTTVPLVPPTQPTTLIIPKLAGSAQTALLPPKTAAPLMVSTQAAVPSSVPAQAAAPPVVSAQAAVSAQPTPVAMAATVASSQPLLSNEANAMQEEADILISKLIREECENLEVELRAVIHKGQNIKIDLGSDSETETLVSETDAILGFLTEVTETSSSQAAEIQALKQGLIQTWAWYEDARSRFAQIQDSALEIILRIQRLDPVFQRYLGNIKHLSYYLESQLTQAGRVLDEQWDNFQDFCRKIVRMKIPTMEAIYQTMVRQSAIHQKQKYVLKDISCRLRSHRSKVTGPSLLMGVDYASRLENELHKLTLDSEQILRSQYERVYQKQKKLSDGKIRKLSELLLNRKITQVAVSKPQISKTNLQSLIQSSPAVNTQALVKNVSESGTLFGVGLSPVSSTKVVAPRMVSFSQSTPKLTDQNVPTTPVASLPPESRKVLPTAPAGLLGQTMAATPKLTPAATTLTAQPKSAGVPTSLFSSVAASVAPSTAATGASQLNFNFSQSTTTTPQMFTTSNQAATTKPISSNQPINFGSFFGTNKSATFNFGTAASSATTTISSGASSPAITTPLANTSSAFVPTTQVNFDFGAKTAIGTVTATSPTATATTTAGGLFALTKSPTFNFGPSNFSFTTGENTTTVSTAGSTGSITSLFIPTNSTGNFTSLQDFFKAVSTAETTSSGSLFIPTTSTGNWSSLQGFFKAVSAAETTTSSGNLFAPKPVTTTPLSATTKIVTSPQTSNSTIASSTMQSPQLSFMKTTTAETTVFSTTGVQSPPQTTTSTTLTDASSIFKTSLAVTTSVTSFASPSLGETSFKFGTPPANTSIFGATAASSQSTTTAGSSIFAAATVAVTKSIFSTSTSPVVTPAAVPISVSTAASAFAPAATSASIFGTSSSNKTAIGTSVFDNQTAASATATTLASIFSTRPIAATSTTSNFGAAASPSTTSTSIFASPASTTTTSIFAKAAAVASTTASAFGALSPTAATATLASTTFGQPASTTPSVFGQAKSTTQSVFGQVTSTTPSGFGQATSTTPSVFEQPTSTTPSVFGQATSATPSGFGQVTSTTPSVFGQATSTTPSVFGQPATNTTSVFGAIPPASTSSSVFGTPASTTASVFGQPATTAPSVFGASPTGASIFGNAAKTTASTRFSFNNTDTSNTFGSTTFGNAPTTSNSSTLFGSKATTSNSNSFFGNTNTSSNFSFATTGNSVFGTPSSTTTNIFGQTPTSSFSFTTAAASNQSAPFGSGFSKPSFGFGSPPVSNNESSFSFGNLNMGATTTQNTGFGTVFGQQPQTSNPFAKAAEQKPAFGGGSLFGTPTTTSSSVFGGGSTPAFGSSSAFGSPSGFGSPPSSTFGQQSTFGQNSFGGSAFGSPQPGPFSGGNQSVAQSGFGGFGQNQTKSAFGSGPVFGGSPSGFGSPPTFGGSSFGNSPSFGSPSKVFGESNTAGGTFGPPATAPTQSSTFANLATQNTLGFGALAAQQQTMGNNQQFPSASSSFSTWR